MRLVALSLLFCPTLVAQTSPRGLDAVEGNTTFAHWTGSRRFQQLDYTQAGTPTVITSVAWRRNGGVTQASALTRTFDFTVEMGHTNFGAISHKLDNNYLPGTRTTVYSQPGTIFPDWTANLGAPAPFDFVVPLTTPFVYNGTDALVIDFAHTNNSLTSSVSTDRDFNGPTTPTTGVSLGVGCIATGMPGAFTHNAWVANANNLPSPAYGMRLRMGGTNAPPSSPVLAWIDFQNQNVSGVLCSTLYTFPVLQFVMGSEANGTVADVSYGFTHDPSLVSGTFFSQFIAFDLAIGPIPVVVSNGRQLTMPAPTPAGTQHRCSYGWYSLPNPAGIATHFVGGGMVMRLQ